MTIGEIEAQGWSLNPGRYVGTDAEDDDDAGDFTERLMVLHEEFTMLSDDAEDLRRKLDTAIRGVIGS